jgi:ribose-phosphate pyrophosphokinase
MLGSRIAVFHGSSHPRLAQAICRDLCVPVGQAHVSKFSDGETSVEIGENVRGVDCYIVQPTCAPTNDSVMELLVMVDALRRSAAESITAVVPYYGYARQDRRAGKRVAITAKLIAKMFYAAGVNRVVTVDLHAGQEEGFFDERVGVENLYARPVLFDHLKSKFGGPDCVVVSPDAGGTDRARGMAKLLDTGLAIIDKRRERANESEVMNVIGEVRGKACLILDDMIDTAGTLVKAAQALMNNGAASVSAVATHAVLSGEARAKIKASPLTSVIVTDSIHQEVDNDSKIVVVTIADLLAEAIRCLHNNDSVSRLHR